MYTITYPAQDRPLVNRISGYSPASARQAVSRLEHIARWLRTLELQNPHSQLAPGAVRLWITRHGAQPEIGPDELVFSYEQVGGNWEAPTYDVHLENTTGRDLYVTVLSLGESFTIDPLFTNQPVMRLGAGETHRVQVWGSVPDDAWQQGVTDRQDVFKLIASTDEFDARLLCQGRLDTARSQASRALAPAARSTLQRLMRRVQTREVSDAPLEQYSDWVTAQLLVIHHRPLDGQPVPHDGEPVALGAGVRLAPHARLEARARVADVPLASREVGMPEVPDLLSGRLLGSQPYVFRVTRGMTAENMLELRNVTDYTVVTPQEPLRLYLPERLSPRECVLAYGHDGEFFLPLGSSRVENNQTYIDLQCLPSPGSTGRDLSGAVRIFFQKITRNLLAVTPDQLAFFRSGVGGDILQQVFGVDPWA